MDLRKYAISLPQLGKSKNKEPYQYKMSDDFIPWRRDVNFIQANEIAIESLIDQLSFIKNKQRWGFVFQYGLVSIASEDFRLIASAMGVNLYE